jgi:hypothetical protein
MRYWIDLVLKNNNVPNRKFLVDRILKRVCP